MDQQWIKILAQSHIEDGQWKSAHPQVARDHSRKQWESIITRLLADMTDAIDIFNRHTRHPKKLKILAMKDTHATQQEGFLVVVGKLHLQVLKTQAGLETVISRTSGFQSTSELLHRFRPHVDPFGGISWIMDEKSIMTEDMIIKQLLHDLCHEAHVSEW